MNIISRQAAVAVDSEVHVPSDESALPSNPTPTTAIKTLWASKPLQIHAGRAVAVRINSGLVEVGIIENGTSQLRWTPLATALSGAQERKWMREAKFTER